MSSEDRQLGEYRLIQIVAENPLSHTWLAEQVSVSRKVLVDELRDDRAADRDAFLADVRAKASVEHPLIGSVFEAVAENGVCFFAHELLPGVTLENRLSPPSPFKPSQLAHILRRIAEAHLQHETLDQATSPLELRHIHLDEHGVIRLDNLATAGPRSSEQSLRDITRLGGDLPPLVSDGLPGATRLLTLLGWMRGVGLDAPIAWGQVRDFCLQIEQQLAEPLSNVPSAKPANRVRKKPPVALIAIVSGVALVGIIVAALKMRPQPPAGPLKIAPAVAILVSEGQHPTPDGTTEQLHAFGIASHEVTIGEYARFLDTLNTLAKDQRERTFDHEDQPADKSSHVPEDWKALLAAARAVGSWNARPVSLDSPVVGVDWWDGAAYAEWKQGRLPSQEEWFAGLRQGVDVPSSIPASDWLPVDGQSTDRTPRGLLGMAGSVCEWTRRPAANPANPLGERKWVIIGGSYLKPGSNALSREWTSDRGLRRADLGFRIVTDTD